MKNKKKAMGRGLGAILSAEATHNINTAADSGAEEVVGNILEIPVENIIPNESQPRQSFDERALNDLAQSIKNLGVIQPITVRKESDKFLIISGERRYRASKIAGLQTIPAYIRLVNDQELLEMALVENIQREDLDAIEVALTYERLIDEIGLTQESLSERVGKERSTITNSLRLLKLSPDIQGAIRAHQISAGHGRAIISLPTQELQDEVLQRILKESLNVRQTEDLVSRLKNGAQNGTTSEKKVRQIPNHLRKAQKLISDSLGLNVEIRSTKKGDKGKIVLDFMSEEDLDRILKAFGG